MTAGDRPVARTVYYTATSLDGWIADEADNLDWLLEQHVEDDGPGGYSEFLAGIGAVTMGATTYLWVAAHMRRTGEPWAYDVPVWVFTHRDLEPVDPRIRFVAGDVRPHHAGMVAAAGDRGVWVVGGGDLAGQLADHGLLDQVVVSIAPVTLGSGRPLFPRRHDLRLDDVGRNGDFVVATYGVRGPRQD